LWKAGGDTSWAYYTGFYANIVAQANTLPASTVNTALKSAAAALNTAYIALRVDYTGS